MNPCEYLADGRAQPACILGTKSESLREGAVEGWMDRPGQNRLIRRMPLLLDGTLTAE
jgi:hypothetical protein